MALLKWQTLERLMQYYHYIEQVGPEIESFISSAQLARSLSLDDTQIRKDLAAIGVKGHRRVGFNVKEMHHAIQQTLGLTDSFSAVVVGTGRIGGAIASYPKFAQYGLDIVALFDVNPAKIGMNVANHVIQPIEQLESIIKQRSVALAILTVPAETAQALADRLVAAGIKAIWNFSAVGLVIPPDIIVRNEHLSLGWAQLSYHLKQKQIQHT